MLRHLHINQEFEFLSPSLPPPQQHNLPALNIGQVHPFFLVKVTSMPLTLFSSSFTLAPHYSSIWPCCLLPAWDIFLLSLFRRLSPFLSFLHRTLRERSCFFLSALTYEVSKPVSQRAYLLHIIASCFQACHFFRRFAQTLYILVTFTRRLFTIFNQSIS